MTSPIFPQKLYWNWKSDYFRKVRSRACPPEIVGGLGYNYINNNERKTKMGNIAEIVGVACDECGGAGFIFFGDEKNYDVESCECVKETWGI